MQKYLMIPLVLFSTSAVAWICPNNFAQIGIGDTLEQVQKQCGKPGSEVKTEKEPNMPQEWKYYIAVNQPYQNTYSPSHNPPSQASIKMSVTFVNDKAINITVEAQSLTSTSVCGPTINTGDNQESIKSACGKPVFIQKQQDSKVAPIEIIEYKYNSAPPNTLIFENGILKYRK